MKQGREDRVTLIDKLFQSSIGKTRFQRSSMDCFARFSRPTKLEVLDILCPRVLPREIQDPKRARCSNCTMVPICSMEKLLQFMKDFHN